MTKLTYTYLLKSGGKPLLAAAVAALCLQAQAQTYSLTPLWYDSTNTLPGAHVASSGDVNRGLAYYAASNIVFVCNKGITGSGSTPAVDALDGSTGAYLGTANMTGVTANSASFDLDQIAVSGDGILYGASLDNNNHLNIYQWTNWTTPPTVCFAGAPSSLGTIPYGARVGDSMTLTGSGTNTLILFDVNNSTTPTTNFVLFSTVNGVTFTPTVLEVSGMPAASGADGPESGYCFYTNNTFLFNPESSTTYLIQFPTNFATLAPPVTATVLTSVAFGGNPEVFSYDPASGLLAVAGPIPNSTGASTVTPISLYKASPLSLLSSALATTNFSTTNANGNFVGGVALGGVGNTNNIYVLDCNNGVQAETIVFQAGAVPPSITSEPTGGTFYSSLPSFTFTVAAGGTAPLFYQWQFNSESNLDTATNILGETNNTFTLTNPTVAESGWYDVMISNAGGVTNSIPVELTVLNPTTNAVFTNLWNLSPSSRPYLDAAGDYDTRGLAFDTNTMTLLVCDKGADLGIYVLNATNDADMFTLNTIGVGVTGAQFPLDQVGVGDDGVVYACDLYDTTSTAGTFAIYEWSSVASNAGPSLAYGPGDPSAPGIVDRWGDTMAVRGAGAKTQILLGSYDGYLGGPSTNAALLTNPSGAPGDPSFGPFVALPLIITNAGGIPAGFSSLGICFGVGNTFWAKSPGYDLYEIAFDPVTGNCNILLDITNNSGGTSSFNSMSSICLDPLHNLLTGITFNDVPNDLAVYQLYGTPAAPLNQPPVLADQAFFPSNLGNSQDNGVTVIKYPYIFGLDVNNGLTALKYGIPAALGLPNFSITNVINISGTGLVLTLPTQAGHSYQLQYEAALSSTNHWLNLGSSVIANSTSLSFTNSVSGPEGFYRVAAQ